MEAKFSSRLDALLLLDVCQFMLNDVGQNVDVSENDVFSPNCSKFVVEYDWNSEFPQMGSNFVFFGLCKIWFFGKLDEFFRKKALNFLSIAKFGIFL